ncbi:hypothetical protein N9955_00550 [bacterium]|nr:hypothetical protein [bacterium]
MAARGGASHKSLITKHLQTFHFIENRACQANKNDFLLQKGVDFGRVCPTIMPMKDTPINFILNQGTITSFIQGQCYSCSVGSLRYKAAIQAISDKDNEAFNQAMTCDEVDTLNKQAADQGFEVADGVLKLDGVEIIGSLQIKLTRMLEEELPITNFVAFIRKLRKNPSRSAVKELYDFLAYAELPITQDGNLIAYKGVNEDYWSCTAGKTVLSKGKVNASGRVFNGIGEVIECERVEVDDDRRNYCSNGLHVGSHDYATSFGNRTVVVEVDPAHVVSVPLDCGCQKMRVCGYRVVCDYGNEIKGAVVDGEAQEVKSDRASLAEKIDERISSLKKRAGDVTVKRVQSALSPECPSLHVIRDIAVNVLGYDVYVPDVSNSSVGSMIID